MSQRPVHASDEAGHRRERRKQASRRRTHRRRRAVAAAVGVLMVGGIGAAIASGLGSQANARPQVTVRASRAVTSVPDVAPPLVSSAPAPAARLSDVPGGRLGAAVQDAAVAAVGDRVVAAGGLTAADTSTSEIVTLAHGSSRVVSHLPGAQHDAAAAALGGSVYVFGGGDGVRQLDHVIRIDPVTGRSTTVGRLPQPSSDSTAATVGATAYVIGGYTGTRWLDTVVAFRPGSSARVAAHLPVPLRYAAATAVGRLIVIAGGSIPDGSASRAVYVFDPARASVRRLGSLPIATTHAAAATIGGVAYVVGGRGAVPGTPVARIVAIDPAHARIVAAGSLREPLSDLSAVALGGRILVIGGHGTGGTTSELRRLTPRSRRASAARTTRAASSRTNVYAATGANMLAPAARRAKQLVYVPNSQSNTVDVIDQHTFKVVRHFAVGGLPQHVTPSWDLRTLYVDNDRGNSLTPIDPTTGRQRGPPVPVDDPYNLYFTPNGRFAIVVAEALHRLDFRDARTMKLRHSVPVPCSGVDHIDFTADGTRMVASCEFSSQLIVLDVPHQRVVRVLDLPRSSSMPQDVKLAPDGTRFYIADMQHAGVWMLDARTFRFAGFLTTGAGAHGLYPSRDARLLYVSNRDAGTISVVSFATRRVVKTWHIPDGTPDMGGVSADGRTLWLSGRYRSEVYAIDTRTGALRARIPVGSGPHGLAVWPQPGRYSLGHTGILR